MPRSFPCILVCASWRVSLVGAGAVIGAAGASGGTGDEDEEIVIAGIVAAGLGHA